MDRKRPIVLVATQTDLRSQESDHITKEEGQELAKQIGAFSYLECSAVERTGVKEVYEQVVMATLKCRKRRSSLIKRVFGRWGCRRPLVDLLTLWSPDHNTQHSHGASGGDSHGGPLWYMTPKCRKRLRHFMKATHHGCLQIAFRANDEIWIVLGLDNISAMNCITYGAIERKTGPRTMVHAAYPKSAGRIPLLSIGDKISLNFGSARPQAINTNVWWKSQGVKSCSIIALLWVPWLCNIVALDTN